MTNNFDETHEGFPIADEIDNAILMHRDAHFSGSFDLMLDYYAKEGKGVNPDFAYDKILGLAEEEKAMGQNLAAVLLSMSEIERIAEAKLAYKSLKELYEGNSKALIPRLIADLILSEEEMPEKEIEAIVAQKSNSVPALVDLIRAESFYDPLFPGYGQAPGLAAICLGQIGDKKALISLFEAIGTGDFFNDEVVLRALKMIGEPAKEFLLKVVQGKPYNEDNEKAAIALVQFKDEKEVGETCLQLLQSEEVRKDLSLATYLVVIFEGLSKDKYQKPLESILNDPTLPKPIALDLKVILKTLN